MSSITGVSAADTNPTEDPKSPLEGDTASTGRLGDRLFGGAALGAGLTVVVLVALVGFFLVTTAVPSLMRNEVNFLTSREWVPSGAHPRFGIALMLWVTVISSILAMLVAVPLGVGVALFITQYAPPWLAKPAAQVIDLLAAVPSIVYGLWASRSRGSTTTRSRRGSRAS